MTIGGSTTGASTAGASPKRVRIASGSNRVTVVASADAGLRVSGQADVRDEQGRVTIAGVRSALTVEIPEGSEVIIGTTSGRVRCSGRLGLVAITTKSGRVDVDHAASLDVRTASARVTVESVVGACRIHTLSGSVNVGASGDSDVSTKSGRITLAQVTGAVSAHSVSGRISVIMTGARDVFAETVSGRIDLSMPRGGEVHHVTPGSALPPPGAAPTVVARSTNGKVVVEYQ